MSNIHVNFNEIIGKVKPLHAGGQPPFLGIDFSYTDYLEKAGVPYSRLHDVGGLFGGNRFVDIPNIFRDFDADETDPESYDFAFTDILLSELVKRGVKPYYRLGVTIENFSYIKAYRIFPPKDYAKWARVCEHIIRHYNEGWANGFYYDIEYWEIWNEPDATPRLHRNAMWRGSAEDFYRLYDVTAKHLKACFGDKIKVGGYGATSFGVCFFHPEEYGIDKPAKEIDDEYFYQKELYRMNFARDFFAYAKEHNSPLDFFSWHSYEDIETTLIFDRILYTMMQEYGFSEAERHLNEWNTAFGCDKHGTSFASASTAAMMCAMQHSHTDIMCFYDMRLMASSFGCLFSPLKFKPVCTYYSFFAFNKLYKLGDLTRCEIQGDNLYALAATNGKYRAVMISNHKTICPTDIVIPDDGCEQLPDGAKDVQLSVEGCDGLTVYIIDRDNLFTKTNFKPKSFTLKSNQVAFLTDLPESELGLT